MAYVSALGLWDIARPHLAALVARTGESSSMAQLDGSDIVDVARVSVPKLIALRVEIGTHFPAVQTSQGKVLLAALPADQVSAALSQPSRSGLPPYIGRSPEQLRDELSEVRARGWALADEELAPGVRSVAVPVRDGTGAVRAAMNVTVHAAETTTQRLLHDYLPLLLTTAGEISAEWAYGFPVRTWKSSGCGARFGDRVNPPPPPCAQIFDKNGRLKAPGKVRTTPCGVLMTRRATWTSMA